MRTRCLIVDDEPLARKLLASYVAKMEVLDLVGECNNAVDAGEAIRSARVDLVFLDVQMPDVTGLQLVKTLKNPPGIIFTTAYRDFAVDAFDLDAIDYLVKPISMERFLASINRYLERSRIKDSGDGEDFKTTEGFVYFKSERKTVKLSMANVRYIESLDDYVKIYTANKTWITREKISVLEKLLPEPMFIRIHRSFIINTSYLTAFSGDSVFLNNQQLPFGRAFKRAALRILLKSK